MIFTIILLFLLISISPFTGRWLARICNDEIKPGKLWFRKGMHYTVWSLITLALVPLLLRDLKGISIFLVACVILYFFFLAAYYKEKKDFIQEMKKNLLVAGISYIVGILLFLFL